MKFWLLMFFLFYFYYSGLCLSDCVCSHDLYGKRLDVLQKYKSEVGNDYLKNKDKADIYKREIGLIDQEYRSLIYQLLFELERKENRLFNECCNNKIGEDRYLFFVCKFIEYKTSGNVDRLFVDLPTEKEGFYPFWEIDSITIGPFGYPKHHPKLLDTSSFVHIFLDAIYRIAVHGDVRAIDVFFKLQTFADGEYGEYMDDKVLNLFENYPEVVMRNWKLIKKYSSTIDFETTDYQKKAGIIIHNYHNLCERFSIHPSVCNEIIKFLETRVQRR